MPTNLGSPPICTSCFSVDPSLHDAGSIGPGNCPGSTVRECGDPCYWTVCHDPDATGLPRSGPPRMSYCRRPKSGYKMLPRNHPGRVQITFGGHRLVANAGLLLSGHPGPAPWPAPTPPEAPRPRRRAGSGEHGRQDDDAGGLRAGGRRLHRRRRCVAHRRDRPRSRFHGQGALHLGHFPAQLQVGPRPSTGPGEPPVAGPGMAGRSRTGRRAIHHRP